MVNSVVGDRTEKITERIVFEGQNGILTLSTNLPYGCTIYFYFCSLKDLRRVIFASYYVQFDYRVPDVLGALAEHNLHLRL